VERSGVADSAPLTLTAYAARRGVSKMAVSRAVKAGRLARSVVRDDRGQPKIADPDLADREWSETTDLSRAPAYVKERAEARDPSRGGRPPRLDDDEGEPEGLSLGEQSAREKFWKANNAELDYRERAGELVNAKAMAAKVGDLILRCRTKLLGVPTRMRQRLPHLTAPDVAEIDALMREALEELSEDRKGEA
jgi:hypothetical protein